MIASAATPLESTSAISIAGNPPWLMAINPSPDPAPARTALHSNPRRASALEDSSKFTNSCKLVCRTGSRLNSRLPPPPCHCKSPPTVETGHTTGDIPQPIGRLERFHHPQRMKAANPENQRLEVGRGSLPHSSAAGPPLTGLRPWGGVLPRISGKEPTPPRAFHLFVSEGRSGAPGPSSAAAEGPGGEGSQQGIDRS